ncbi:hypothetical protein TrVE_jg13752 [Triparma verrucosa]|uniref:Uncharacterized protein n=1 Tax=Triparma verrucosa TaxID=1606542 RepID=A0A9W7F8K6_9STRA|nr:hypothetical protein TrVE_jg13752 [Triparma verrucosa]
MITTSFYTILSTLTSRPNGNQGVSDLRIALNLLDEVRVIKLDGSARFIIYLSTTLEHLTGFGKLRQQNVARFLQVVAKDVLPEFYGCLEKIDDAACEDVIKNCLGNQLKGDTDFVAGLVKEYCSGGCGGEGEVDIILLPGASLGSSRVTEQGEMWLSGCRLRNEDEKKSEGREKGFNFVCMFSDPFVPTLNNISVSTPLDGLSYDKISSTETLASMKFASKLKSLGVDVVVCTFSLSPSLINCLRREGIMYVSNLEEYELEKLAWKGGIDFYEDGGGVECVARCETLEEVKVGVNDFCIVFGGIQVPKGSHNRIHRQLILRSYNVGGLRETKKIVARCIKFIYEWLDDGSGGGNVIGVAGFGRAEYELVDFLGMLRERLGGEVLNDAYRNSRYFEAVERSFEECGSNVGCRGVDLDTKLKVLDGLMKGFSEVPKRLWGREGEGQKRGGEKTQEFGFTCNLFTSFVEFLERVYRVENVVQIKKQEKEGKNCTGRIVKDRRRLGRGIKGDLRGEGSDDDDDDDDLW